MLSDYLHKLSSSSDYEHLPARVSQAIRHQQEHSEIIIGWFQLGIVCTFTVLFALSPKPYSADLMFSIEPWILGTYVVFTILRLVLAYRRQLPDWLLYISIIVDMALLLILIWSIHLKYEQPASFYLKVPTLLYVFIFIALRALRSEVRYVVLAGSTAAVGWLVMVWYVISIDPNDPMLTRNYVEYMTSNSVLLGAEFDKVISILIVTAILAVAISRARAMLVHAVVQGATARDLSLFVPSQVVRQVTSAEHEVQAGQGEVREATILFSDIEGFTTIGERLSPEQLIATLNEYFTAVSEPITRHGGVINQFQGDAILATFNLPDQHPQHAADAVAAALEIQALLNARTFGGGIRLRSRIGINSGVVVGGLVGSQDRLSYTVHGDEVNLAARLEQLNKEHATRILVSERTVHLAAGDRFQFERIGTVSVRGRKKPVTVYTTGRDANAANLGGN